MSIKYIKLIGIFCSKKIKLWYKLHHFAFSICFYKNNLTAMISNNKIFDYNKVTILICDTGLNIQLGEKKDENEKKNYGNMDHIAFSYNTIWYCSGK